MRAGTGFIADIGCPSEHPAQRVHTRQSVRKGSSDAGTGESGACYVGFRGTVGHLLNCDSVMSGVQSGSDLVCFPAHTWKYMRFCSLPSILGWLMDSSRKSNFFMGPISALLLNILIEPNYTVDVSLNIGLDMASDS